MPTDPFARLAELCLPVIGGGAGGTGGRGEPFRADVGAPEALSALRLGDRELLERLVAGAGRVASRMAPVAELHVHVSKASLDTGEGVARAEEVGPMTLAQVRSWLLGERGTGAEPGRAGAGVGRARIRVQPVLDPEGVAAVDRYEVPPPLRRAVEELQPFDPWPWGTTDARRCDQDHVEPYRPDGTPGQTALDNLAPLGRRHHRIKTFGAWRVTKVGTSAFWWRSPTGHWFHVGVSGTCHVGRGSDLDAVLLRKTADSGTVAQRAS